jgi:hypothetical protein
LTWSLMLRLQQLAFLARSHQKRRTKTAPCSYRMVQQCSAWKYTGRRLLYPVNSVCAMSVRGSIFLFVATRRKMP